MSEKPPMKNGSGGHEKRDIDVRRVAVYGGAAILAICLIGLLVTVLIFKNLARETESSPVSPLYQGDQLPPEPRLQANPRLDLKKLREEEQTRLDSYHWVDKANGIVGIPIDRALEIVAREGLPARPDARIEPAPTPGQSPANAGPSSSRLPKGKEK